MYWDLGNTPFQREAAYRELLERGLVVGIFKRLVMRPIRLGS